MMKNIKIRPHHTLCTQFFVGNGYNEEFIENMYRILSLLNNENPVVEIVEHCDDICAYCSKNKDGMCENEDNVCDIDSKCMNSFNLNLGDKKSWSDIKSTVLDSIEKYGMPNVCNECSWYKICEGIYKNMQ